MIYAYKCRTCGRAMDSTTRADSLGDCECGGVMARDWRIQVAPATFEGHFNHAVGGYVRNKADFENQLKMRSDEQSERTGTAHSYAPLYPGDVPQPSAGDDIFETRGKILRDHGFTDESGKLVRPIAPIPAPAAP